MSELESIYNYELVETWLATSGFVPPEAFSRIAAAGYDAVVNLIPTGNQFFLEREPTLVKREAMAYHQIPVDFDAPELADFDQFVNLMRELKGQRVWVHCAANYRVTTFVALYGLLHLGWPRARYERLLSSKWEPNEVWQRFAKAVSSSRSVETSGTRPLSAARHVL